MNTPKYLIAACAALVLPLAACGDDDDGVDDIVDTVIDDTGVDTGTDMTTLPGGVVTEPGTMPGTTAP